MIASRRKRVVVAAAVLAIGLLAAIGGYAFWSLSGSGSATADVGTTSDGAVTLAATIPAGIFPGGTRSVTYRATNTNSTDVHIGTVTVTGISADASHPGCTTADFAVAPTVQNVTVAAGATNVALPTAGSLTYANTAVAQDACKGATLTLTLASN